MAIMMITVRNAEDKIIQTEVKTQFIKSNNLKEVTDHLKGNSTTAGFTINYCVSPEKNLVVELFKKGRVCQKDLKELVELGFSEFHYSWAFASKNWKNDQGQTMEFKTLDLTQMKDIVPYKTLFGY